MSANNPMEVFVLLLSDVRRKTERSIEFFQEVSKIAEEPEVKEALEARGFVAQQSLGKTDEDLSFINQGPVSLPGRFEEAFVKDFAGGIAELRPPPVGDF